MIKRLRNSFSYENTGQYITIRFAGFKFRYDGLWWHFAKRSVKNERAIQEWADTIVKEVEKEDE
jgi:hypothetical protein